MASSNAQPTARAAAAAAGCPARRCRRAAPGRRSRPRAAAPATAASSCPTRSPRRAPASRRAPRSRLTSRSTGCPCCRIGEPHMVEQNGSVPGPPGPRTGGAAAPVPPIVGSSVSSAGDRRVGVEDLQHPLRGGGGLLAGGEDVAERLDRPHQLNRARVMKATRPPMVSEWWLTAIAPSTTASAIAAFGTRSSTDQKPPSTPAIAIRVCDSSVGLGEVRAPPPPGRGRAPSAPGPRSPPPRPAWSGRRPGPAPAGRAPCTSARTWCRRRSTGANIAPVISPSHQLRLDQQRGHRGEHHDAEMNRKTMPNPANRRMDHRSVVARDSS